MLAHTNLFFGKLLQLFPIVKARCYYSQFPATNFLNYWGCSGFDLELEHEAACRR